MAIPGECRTPVSRKLCDSTVSRSRRLLVDVSSAMSLPAAPGRAPGDEVGLISSRLGKACANDECSMSFGCCSVGQRSA